MDVQGTVDIQPSVSPFRRSKSFRAQYLQAGRSFHCTLYWVAPFGGQGIHVAHLTQQQLVKLWIALAISFDLDLNPSHSQRRADALRVTSHRRGFGHTYRRQLLLIFYHSQCVEDLSLNKILFQIDVGGFMHFWGLTIDVISCTNLVIAVGLVVDYSAHIVHAFLIQTGMMWALHGSCGRCGTCRGL